MRFANSSAASVLKLLTDFTYSLVGECGIVFSVLFYPKTIDELSSRSKSGVFIKLFCKVRNPKNQKRCPMSTFL
ncbi:hypothetical protein C1634_024980 [Chryseobacterium viscerum]|uniref:Uncharacterized protein n=1 Tax=Chryseobacterium viscerum TaxID=1037377 RepID=A0A316WDA0_9FLAO|nr:hypothetical protein C1634_024980 [Chryseobacterium viscerum]